MAQELLVVLDVKMTPGRVWVDFGKGWEVCFEISKTKRARIRHARMTHGKHGMRRPRR